MNIEEQISQVLGDPEAMGKISSIVSALGGGNPAPPNEPQRENNQNSPAPLSLPDIAGDNRAKLLMALKPFLSEKRAPYVDGAVAILKMMKLGKLTGSLEPIIKALGGN